jgi:hypothetical protein
MEPAAGDFREHLHEQRGSQTADRELNDALFGFLLLIDLNARSHLVVEFENLDTSEPASSTVVQASILTAHNELLARLSHRRPSGLGRAAVSFRSHASRPEACRPSDRGPAVTVDVRIGRCARLSCRPELRR